VWVCLALAAPIIIGWWWYPIKETITLEGLVILRWLIRVSDACFWLLQHCAMWLWIPAFVLWGWGSVFAGCSSCRRGFWCDHAFKERSIISRLILGLVAIANLRFKPWLGATASLTVIAIFAAIILFVLSNPILLLAGLPWPMIFGGWWLGITYYGERAEGVSIFTSMGIVLISLWLTKFTAGWSFTFPVVIALSIVAYKQNEFSRLKGQFRTAAKEAARLCLKRLPFVLLLMLPGLALKAGVDWGANKFLTFMEMRVAQVDTVRIPTLRMESFPWYSPLRWFGVPKPVVDSSTISLEKPKQSFFSVIGLTRTAVATIEIVTFGILALLLARALISMFIRELIAGGIELNAYAPAPRKYLQKKEEGSELNSPPEPSGRERSTGITSYDSMTMNASWGRSVCLKRNLSPSGGVPSAEAAAPSMAFLARLLNRCFVMDHYFLGNATVQLDAAGGRRFVRWELKAGEVLLFEFAHVIGWTDSLHFDTALCLQVGMLAQGRLLVHRAYGPGSIIFELNGEPTFWRHSDSATFTADRLVAFRVDVDQGDARPDFGVTAKGGILNSLIGTVSQRASQDIILLLDPCGHNRTQGNPVFDLLRHTYRILG
jgi:hypothetical protein